MAVRLCLLALLALPPLPAQTRAPSNDWVAAPVIQVDTPEPLTEGPVTDEAGNLYFTETRSQRIYKLTPAGVLTVLRENTNAANGLAFDAQGRLLACEGSTPKLRRPQVTRMDLATGHVEVLASSFEGKPLNGPNDLTVDSKGRIYFTDPAPPGQPGSAVYRIDPGGRITRILAEPDIERPNGIIISPGDRTLYLVESNRVPPDDKTSRPGRVIRAYDLLPGGAVQRMRIFHNFYPGRSADGMAIDTRGNVYAAAGLHKLRGTDETLDTRCGIYVFSPAGKLLRFIPIPEDLLTNCAFGGPDMRTLYVTAGKTVYQIRTPFPGVRR